jgi:hypothetical protein
MLDPLTIVIQAISYEACLRLWHLSHGRQANWSLSYGVSSHISTAALPPESAPGKAQAAGNVRFLAKACNATWRVFRHQPGGPGLRLRRAAVKICDDTP